MTNFKTRCSPLGIRKLLGVIDNYRRNDIEEKGFGFVYHIPQLVYDLTFFSTYVFPRSSFCSMEFDNMKLTSDDVNDVFGIPKGNLEVPDKDDQNDPGLEIIKGYFPPHETLKSIKGKVIEKSEKFLAAFFLYVFGGFLCPTTSDKPSRRLLPAVSILASDRDAKSYNWANFVFKWLTNQALESDASKRGGCIHFYLIYFLQSKYKLPKEDRTLVAIWDKATIMKYKKHIEGENIKSKTTVMEKDITLSKVENAVLEVYTELANRLGRRIYEVVAGRLGISVKEYILNDPDFDMLCKEAGERLYNSLNAIKNKQNDDEDDNKGQMNDEEEETSKHDEDETDEDDTKKKNGVEVKDTEKKEEDEAEVLQLKVLKKKVSQIKDMIKKLDAKKIVFSVGSTDLYVKDFKELYPRKWIGQNVFDSFTHIFNLTWAGSITKNIISSTYTCYLFHHYQTIIDLEEVGANYHRHLETKYDMVIYPLVSASHWKGFAFDFVNKQILYLDSMHKSYEAYNDFLKALKKIIKSKYRQENLDEWEIKDDVVSKQKNNYDCGVYLLQFIRDLGTNKSTNPSIHDREYLLIELANKCDLRSSEEAENKVAAEIHLFRSRSQRKRPSGYSLEHNKRTRC